MFSTLHLPASLLGYSHLLLLLLLTGRLSVLSSLTSQHTPCFHCLLSYEEEEEED